MKHKSAVMRETIEFSICNKPFKPIGLLSGQMKFRDVSFCVGYILLDKITSM